MSGETAKRRVSSKKISQITNNLFSTLVDLTLFSFFFLPLSSFGQRATSSGVYKTFKEADELLSEFNYQSFKNALRKLKEKGLVENLKEWHRRKLATKDGLIRLREMLPQYREKRDWDSNLYVLQYDVPVKQNLIRDALRRFLKKLGALKLQDSTYLVFSDPSKLIKKFIEEYQEFLGNILISKLTKNGFLGDIDLVTYLWTHSGLAKANDEYREFIEKYKKDKSVSPAQMSIEYYSILEKDPQIPFELLPNEYLGDEAYLLFLRLVKNTLFYSYVRNQ